MLYFSSDFHLGHKNILKYRTQFKTIEEHDNAILNLIERLTKRDVLIILGDFIFDSDNYDYYIERINKAQCRIKLVMGNHDSLKLYKEDRFEIQLPFFSYKNIWVSHCPIHPQEIRGRYGNVHGHLHGDYIDDPRYFNVNLDNNNFKFVSSETIRNILK